MARPIDIFAQICYNGATMKCDLHLHTTCSDGVCTPEKIVNIAKQRGLDAIAITDHDTVSGTSRAIAEGKKVGLRVLPGMEISTVSGSVEVHVLAYNLDSAAPGFAEELAKISGMRDERNVLLLRKLAENGMPISEDALKKREGSFGRADIAREMVRLGYCKTVSEAFDKYIGKGKECYVATRRLTPSAAVEFVKRFGGVAVLAHPKNLKMTGHVFEKFLKGLVAVGLDGIEAEYFTHNNFERNFFVKMARKYGLIVTGGSDFHDEGHGISIGKKFFVPDESAKRKLNLND